MEIYNVTENKSLKFFLYFRTWGKGEAVAPKPQVSTDTVPAPRLLFAASSMHRGSILIGFGVLMAFCSYGGNDKNDEAKIFFGKLKRSLQFWSVHNVQHKLINLLKTKNILLYSFKRTVRSFIDNLLLSKTPFWVVVKKNANAASLKCMITRWRETPYRGLSMIHSIFDITRLELA